MEIYPRLAKVATIFKWIASPVSEAASFSACSKAAAKQYDMPFQTSMSRTFPNFGDGVTTEARRDHSGDRQQANYHVKFQPSVTPEIDK